MKSLPLLSDFFLNSVSVLSGKLVSSQIILLFVFVTTSSFGQRSYYEYNNPDALRLTKKSIDLLASTEWAIKDISWLIRKDTFNYRGNGTLTFRKDGSLNGYHEGTWQVKYNRYLVINEPSDNRNLRNLSGVYSITSIADSMLTLTKVHTSSRDMSRTIKLVKYRGYGDQRGGKEYPAYDKYGKEYSWKSEWKRRNALTPALVDSLTFLQQDVLELLGYRESRDTLFIDTPDSLYRIRLDRSNPLRRVKIFYEDDVVEGYEAYRRFTLSTVNIPLVDSLALNYIRQHREYYSPQKEITSLTNYFRQYVGYFDVNGDAIVFLNASCQYTGSWQESLVQVGLGGVCYFNISINLTKKEAFSFYVNEF